MTPNQYEGTVTPLPWNATEVTKIAVWADRFLITAAKIADTGYALTQRELEIAGQSFFGGPAAYSFSKNDVAATLAEEYNLRVKQFAPYGSLLGPVAYQNEELERHLFFLSAGKSIVLSKRTDDLDLSGIVQAAIPSLFSF